MKSVGEAMVRNNFQEALQKACQSLEIKRNGLGADGRELKDQNKLLDSLKNASWNRLFHIYDSLKLGLPFKTIQDITKIDKWFLNQINELVFMEKEIQKFSIDDIPKSDLKLMKEKGYVTDKSFILGCLESEVFSKKHELGIKEIISWLTHVPLSLRLLLMIIQHLVMKMNQFLRQRESFVIGSGPNRIGQGIEFDYYVFTGF